MTTTAQNTALAAPAARTVYFLEMQFRSATQRVSSMNMDYTWGDRQSAFIPGTLNNYLSTPDSVAASQTGDITLMGRVIPVDATPAAIMAIIGKVAAAQKSFKFEWLSDGRLNLQTSIDGVNAVNHFSTVAVSSADGAEIYVKAKLRCNNGAGGHNVSFWLSTNGYLWTQQIGATVVTAGVIAALFDGTAPVTVGGIPVDSQYFNGQILYAELRSGDDGPIVVSMNAQDAQIGATSWVSSATGETWTANQSGGTPAAITGGVLWKGLGALGSVDSIQEANSLDTKALNFGLNAADLAWLALAIGDVEDYCGQPAKLYFCPLNENFQLVGTPEICWRGLMDLITVGIDVDGKGRINLKCETTAYGLKRLNSLRMNAAQQKKRHPTDTGFDYLTSLISQPQLWLTKRFQSQ